MSHRAFISYASEDQEIADQVYQSLEGDGIGCWIASRNIEQGVENWSGPIMEALISCEIVVLIFSKDSNESDYVYNEVERAFHFKKPILIFRIDETEPAVKLAFFLSSKQWFDNAEDKLDQQIEVLTETIKHKRYLQYDATNNKNLDVEHQKKVLNELDWAITSLEHNEETPSNADVDKVFNIALKHAPEFYSALHHEAAADIYYRAASGISKVFKRHLEKESTELLYYLEQSLSALDKSLEQFSQVDSKNSVAICDCFQKHFSHFIDRKPLQDTDFKTRTATWIWCSVMTIVALVSLFVSYGNASFAWDVQFAYPFGGAASNLTESPKVGMWVEFSRTILLVCAFIYLIDFNFRFEAARIYSFFDLSSWKHKSELIGRCFFFLFTATLVWGVVDYHLVKAPTNLMNYADQVVSETKSKDKLGLTNEQMGLLSNEVDKDDSTSHFDGHEIAYRYYLPYSLVNYAGLGAIVLFAALFSVFLDAQELLAERKSLFNVIERIGVENIEIEEAFTHFYTLCKDKSRRYIILFAWIAGCVAFENFFTKSTLADAAWIFEFLASFVIGLNTLLWIGFLTHFYEGAYQRCHSELSRRGIPTEPWEKNFRTVKFLVHCFNNHVAGVFAILYLWPIVFEVSKWKT